MEAVFVPNDTWGIIEWGLAKSRKSVVTGGFGPAQLARGRGGGEYQTSESWESSGFRGRDF
jgi:hypothetical protein